MLFALAELPACYRSSPFDLFAIAINKRLLTGRYFTTDISSSRVTNCPGMPGTVPESRVCVPRPGQKQSGTIKCPGIGGTALIMVKELLVLYLARVGRKSTFSIGVT